MRKVIKIIAIVFYILIVVLYVFGDISRSRTMNRDAAIKAQCDSVGGVLGGGKCFVNGKELNES